MSQHEIHGLTINVTVSQGRLTDQARGRCIGMVVNFCRALPAAEFVTAMQSMAVFGRDGALLLNRIDDELARNYTRRYEDDFSPIASLEAC